MGNCENEEGPPSREKPYKSLPYHCVLGSLQWKNQVARGLRCLDLGSLGVNKSTCKRSNILSPTKPLRTFAGNVVNALAFKKPHVPFRDSKLTTPLSWVSFYEAGRPWLMSSTCHDGTNWCAVLSVIPKYFFNWFIATAHEPARLRMLSDAFGGNCKTALLLGADGFLGSTKWKGS